MPLITLDPSHWQTDSDALRREWLVTNGLGGWASGTVGGANTRRYHGTLVAALHPPVARTVLVSKLDEWATVNGARYGLSGNEFASGAIDPRGWQHLQKFELEDGLPHWHYQAGQARLEKIVFMVHGHNATWTIYKHHSGDGPLALEITPLLNHRDCHGQTTAGDWQARFIPVEDGTAVSLFSGAHPVWLIHKGGAFTPDPVWIRGVQHRIETGRGLPNVEDVLRIGTINTTLQPGDTFAVMASAEMPTAAARAWQDSLSEVLQRQAALVEIATLGQDAPEWVKQLTLAADQFIVVRTDSKTPPVMEWRAGRETDRTVIAGYHWFSDWGRDTMIALPGLTLSTGRPAEAASMLRTFARHISQGMLPNRFPDSGETPEYNAADATLWYFHAIDRYTEATTDLTLARELFPALEDIVDWHLRGTRYNIHCQSDGLIFAGQPGVQLTWMDAKVDDWVVTPRIGKPVEINALWINALRVMEKLAGHLRVNPARDYAALAARAVNSFERFWNADGGYLFDLIDGPDGPSDPALRPNQLFAVSLPHAPLDPTSDRARSVVDVCQRALLTPFGLRSLAPDHPDFKATYGGDRITRDGAYHQGTAWGWLIGPFVEAHYKVYGDKNKALSFLAPLADQLTEFGLGSLAEVYDGMPPHAPGGCIAQAWSVAEALRVWKMLNG